LLLFLYYLNYFFNQLLVIFFFDLSLFYTRKKIGRGKACPTYLIHTRMPWYFNVVMNSEIPTVFFTWVLKSFKDILFKKKFKLIFFSFNLIFQYWIYQVLDFIICFILLSIELYLSHYPDHDFYGLAMLAWFIYFLFF
jgi:hypothetical protein